MGTPVQVAAFAAAGALFGAAAFADFAEGVGAAADFGADFGPDFGAGFGASFGAGFGAGCGAGCGADFGADFGRPPPARVVGLSGTADSDCSGGDCSRLAGGPCRGDKSGRPEPTNEMASCRAAPRVGVAAAGSVSPDAASWPR